jgi:hypothetical protein
MDSNMKGIAVLISTTALLASRADARPDLSGHSQRRTEFRTDERNSAKLRGLPW